MTDTLISGARVVTPEAVVETDVLIRGGKVCFGKAADAVSGRRGAQMHSRGRLCHSGRARPPKGGRGTQTIDARGCILLPGFIDIHTHGYGGFDFTLGVYDAATDSFDGSPERSLEALARYVQHMPRLGLTTSYLATMAAPPQMLRERLALLKTFLRQPPAGTRIVGAFLEGPFVSDRMAGAMNPELIQRPDPAVFDHINSAGLVRLALVAPDGGGARLRLIRHITRAGVIVGAGHTDATAEELRQARHAGLKYIVHFLNGPTGHSFKPFHGGGVVEGALADDELYLELIADGYHVSPRYVRDLLARRGPERIVAVSDSMFAAGARGLRSFQMFGVYGRLSPDRKYMHVANSPLTLFGSCLDMPTAFGNLVSWLTRPMEGVWVRRHEALELDAALVAAARMTSTNPARLTGLDRKLGLGSIADGCAADLILARLRGRAGACRLEVQRTWLAGQEIFRKRA